MDSAVDRRNRDSFEAEWIVQRTEIEGTKGPPAYLWHEPEGVSLKAPFNYLREVRMRLIFGSIGGDLAAL